MPNHCSNQFTTTNRELIAKLRECEAAGEEDIVNATVPMPDALRGLMTGSATLKDGRRVTLWREGPNHETIEVPDAERLELLANYGTDSWYEWSVKNHGTKWGAYSSHFSITDGEAAVTFDSAWSPPLEWLKTLVAAYPEGRTQLAYAEGGIGFYGVIVYSEGEVVKDQISDSDFWDTEKSWDDEEVDDPMDMVSPSCRAHLETFSLHTGG